MVKIVPLAGIFLNAALVSIGWLTYIAGILTPDPIVKTILMATARVLPKTLYNISLIYP